MLAEDYFHVLGSPENLMGKFLPKNCMALLRPKFVKSFMWFIYLHGYYGRLTILSVVVDS